MANPFLMTEDDLSPKGNDLNSNPFLMQQSQDAGEDYATDNPFLVQANNPFAGFDDVSEPTLDENNMDFYPPPPPQQTNQENEQLFLDDVSVPTSAVQTSSNSGHHVDSAMSFFGTTITDDDGDEPPAIIKPVALNINRDILSTYDDGTAYSSEDELTRDKRQGPPPRPVPPSKTTQDLILSVSDQLDQTSSHLLGRLPATRTPSPVSMRDLHSPSPTPDFPDLLDVSDVVPHDGSDLMTENNSYGHDFMNMSSVPNDNPFAMDDETVPVKVEPTRPPPPRPTPPRPTPPRRPSPPSAVPAAVEPVGAPPPRPAPIQHEPDLFDMFGSDIPTKPAKPPPPKSNQDILNLFSTPAASASVPIPAAQNDLLSGDILSMDNDHGFGGGMPLMSTDTLPQRPVPPPIPTKPKLPPPPPQVIPEPVSLVSTVNDIPTTIPSDSEGVDNSYVSPIATAAASPSISHTEKENILDDVESSDHSNIESASSINEHVINLNPAPPSPSTISDEQMDTTVDFAGITPIPSANPFASPESEDNQDVIPIHHINPTPVPAPSPALDVFGVSSVVNPVNTIPQIQRSDEFDAFAAKFDSVKKEDHLLLDGFSGASRSVSAEFGKFDSLFFILI